MGFNISGIAINKNFEDNIDSLQKELGWNLKYVREIDFETASENWKDEKFCDIYFSERGTLIFVDFEKCINPQHVDGCGVLAFILSEMSMTFNFAYTESGKLIRFFVETEGNMVNDEGNKLEIENEEDDASTIIWSQLGVVLGKEFWDIEPEEKAHRYEFVAARSESTPQDEEKPQTPTSKKWWQFWK